MRYLSLSLSIDRPKQKDVFEVCVLWLSVIIFLLDAFLCKSTNIRAKNWIAIYVT